MSDILHPINAFPEKLQEIIAHYSEIKGYPAEYFLTPMLGAFSVSLGRTLTLNTGNYTAIGIIWATVVGKPGITKSEAQTDAFRPLKDIQFKILKDFERDLLEHEEQQRNVKPKDRTILPQPPKYVLSDITPEALSMTLANNPRGCGIVYDELAGFVGRFNRYNSGADEQMFLSLFNGDNVIRTRVDQKGNAAIRDTFLSIIGTIQPAVMKEVFANKSISGFFDRWLISYPENVKKQYPGNISINPNIERDYASMINRLMFIGLDAERPQMCYSHEAYQIVNIFQRKIIDVQNRTENDFERSILAKMEIYLHRFSLILQAIEYALPTHILPTPYLLEKVSAESATGAVILCEYFIEQAKKMRVISPIDSLKDVWKEVWLAIPDHGIKFTRLEFVKKCSDFGFSERISDKFLKEHSSRSETSLLYKLGQGLYTKNLF